MTHADCPNPLNRRGLLAAAGAVAAAGLYAILIPKHHDAGGFLMTVQIDADIPGARDLVAGFVKAVTADTGLAGHETWLSMPWLHPITWPGTGEPGNVGTRRYKIKAAYLRRSLSDAQLGAV
uniref:Uncharacterized protein n=1 Tax=Streptomyces sp. NBC_00003 TaxID=2903608 RepID=A0AAU2VFB0_9ACTN